MPQIFGSLTLIVVQCSETIVVVHGFRRQDNDGIDKPFLEEKSLSEISRQDKNYL